MNYQVLKSRMANGQPFLTTTALERINALADNLLITQEQATELADLAKKNGASVMPDNVQDRLTILEEALELLLSGATE